MPIEKVTIPPLLSSDAAGRLCQLVPHLRYAAQLAQEEMSDGTVFLGIMIKNEKEGKVVCEFEVKDFLADMATVFGEGDILEAIAARVVGMLPQ